MLSTSVLLDEDIPGTNRNFIMIGSRAKRPDSEVLWAPQLAVLNRSHQLFKMYMERAHGIGDEGISSILHRPKQHIWIIEGKRLAESVRISCTECRLKMEKCMEQRMGPLPDHQANQGPVPASGH